VSSDAATDTSALRAEGISPGAESIVYMARPKAPPLTGVAHCNSGLDFLGADLRFAGNSSVAGVSCASIGLVLISLLTGLRSSQSITPVGRNCKANRQEEFRSTGWIRPTQFYMPDTINPR
jgi:hypothetical protein